MDINQLQSLGYLTSAPGTIPTGPVDMNQFDPAVVAAKTAAANAAVAAANSGDKAALDAALQQYASLTGGQVPGIIQAARTAAEALQAADAYGGGVFGPNDYQPPTIQQISQPLVAPTPTGSATPITSAPGQGTIATAGDNRTQSNSTPTTISTQTPIPVAGNPALGTVPAGAGPAAVAAVSQPVESATNLRTRLLALVGSDPTFLANGNKLSYFQWRFNVEYLQPGYAVPNADAMGLGDGLAAVSVDDFLAGLSRAGGSAAVPQPGSSAAIGGGGTAGSSSAPAASKVSGLLKVALIVGGLYLLFRR